MRQDDGLPYDLSLPLQHQLKVTARVALVISVFAGLALLLTMYYLFRGQQQENYLHIIQSLTRSHDQLILAMLIGGAIIILVAGLFTWFVMLYSSARIAGPMYRFSRNVELQINEGPVQTIQLRKGDPLQALSSKLSSAAEGLQGHYADQLAVVSELEQCLSREPADDTETFETLLGRLRSIVRRKPS